MEEMPEVISDSKKSATILDTLWLLGSKYSFPNKSSWAGYMSTQAHDAEYKVSSIVPLPFINLEPSNLTTIYTALVFAAEKCQRYKKPCIVTFDQPLFLKAVDIVEASNPNSILSNVIVRLGGFHTLMSFLGSIGHIMTGSGLEDLWRTIYAKNTVPHMISGHAYARALRGHFLTHEVLGIMLLSDLLLGDDEIEEIRCAFEERSADSKSSNELIEGLLNKINSRLEEVSKTSQTGRLWINYWNLVNVVKLYVRAERTGDWVLHVYCVQKMIPIFYATGHNNYAKCSQLYIQQMQKFQNNYPEYYRDFTENGLFTIRRSKKFWSGIWTDMVIEQSLMRAMKTTGGLTHGRGFSVSSLARWIAGMSVCIPVTTAMEDFTGIKSVSSEQHLELHHSRKQRDEADLEKVLKWLEEYTPFQCKDFTSLFS